jgi:hypothetical protein
MMYYDVVATQARSRGLLLKLKVPEANENDPSFFGPSYKKSLAYIVA